MVCKLLGDDEIQTKPNQTKNPKMRKEEEEKINTTFLPLPLPKQSTSI